MTMRIDESELKALPGADLVLQGISDLRNSAVTEQALLVLIAAPRLLRLGLLVPNLPNVARPYEHRLYALLQADRGDNAYSYHLSLIRRVISFSRALESLKGMEGRKR